MCSAAISSLADITSQEVFINPLEPRFSWSNSAVRSPPLSPLWLAVQRCVPANPPQ